MNTINYDDFKIICRMCMLNCDVKFSQDQVISNVFHKLTDLHFETNDDLPKQICSKCFEKINEIHEFMLQCKRTHSALMECLNKQLNVVQNKKIEKIHELQIILDKNVTIQQQTTEFVEDNSLISSGVNLNNYEVEIKDDTNYKLNDDIIPETSEINEDVIDNTDFQEPSNNLEEEIKNEEHKIEFIKVEHVIDETSEIYNDQSINYSENPLLISNTADIKTENIENIEITNLSDLNEDTHSSNCSNTLDPSSELNKNEDKVYKCGGCSTTFNDFNVFKQHKCLLDCKHPFKCDQCSKLFTTLFNLKTHMRTHSGERPFKCDQCLKSFIQLSHLKNHARLHSGERPFKCDVCSKSFANSSYLHKHMSTHTGERPFKCDQCSQSYGSRGGLKKHIRTHSGERPFTCDQCSKSFNDLGNMKKHIRTHTGERPFKCDQCSKSFSDLGNMKTHLRTHTGERPFKCDQCSKSFSTNGGLKKHIGTHSGERP